MSKRTETITLHPPKFGGKEHYLGRPQECPHCGGRGHYCPEGPNDEAPECTHCAGTGKLQAIVDIAWVPANRWQQGFDGSASGVNRATGFPSADLSADAPRVKGHAQGAPRTDWGMDEQTRRKITRR